MRDSVAGLGRVGNRLGGADPGMAGRSHRARGWATEQRSTSRGVRISSAARPDRLERLDVVGEPCRDRGDAGATSPGSAAVRPGAGRGTETRSATALRPWQVYACDLLGSGSGRRGRRAAGDYGSDVRLAAVEQAELDLLQAAAPARGRGSLRCTRGAAPRPGHVSTTASSSGSSCGPGCSSIRARGSSAAQEVSLREAREVATELSRRERAARRPLP